MKEEDISESLGRFEKQQEYKKKKKIEEMEKRDLRITKMKKERIKINEKKRKLNDDLQARKIVLRNKVNNILESGNYKTKNDIYQKVFSEEELNEIKKMSNDDENENQKEEKKDEDFFLTQDKNDNKSKKKNEGENIGYTEDVEKEK